MDNTFKKNNSIPYCFASAAVNFLDNIVAMTENFDVKEGGCDLQAGDDVDERFPLEAVQHQVAGRELAAHPLYVPSQIKT